MSINKLYKTCKFLLICHPRGRDGPFVMEIWGKDYHTRLAQPNQLNFKKTNVMKTSNQRQHIIINMSQKEFESSMEYVLGQWLTQRIEDQDLLTKTYTRAEAASFLKVTPQTLSKYVYNGKLNPIMTGRKMLFTRQELVKFLNTKSKVRWKV